MRDSLSVGAEPVPTLLHISDLHRTSEPRPSNDELIAAIVSDAKRWEAEGIPQPDIIVVSGDLIQGVALDASDADAEIEDQYREAGDFLQSLAREFVDSDRSKVIVVPGNHDVHWARSLSAMRPLDTCPDRIGTKAFEASSRVRWNWKDRRAYEVVDGNMYGSRLELFREFQRNFGTDQNAAIHLYTHERACPEARSARGRGVSNNARARQRPWISAVSARADSRAA